MRNRRRGLASGRQCRVFRRRRRRRRERPHRERNSARPHQGASGQFDDGAQQAGRRANHRHERSSRKKGDGNEIGLASGSFINAIARKGLDLHQQLTPLVKLFDAYQCYFTAIDSPIKSMVDVRDRLKADPGSVTFAFPVGLGSPLHVSVVNVGKTAGAPAKKLVTVVFDSGSDVSVQAAGGHIDVGETSIGSSIR